MTSKVLKLNNFEQKLVWSLTFSIVAAVFLYIYFVNSSIMHTAAREENREAITVIETEVSDLVSEYLALSGSIDLTRAETLGFVETSKRAGFAFRGGQTVTLTLNNEI